MIGSTLSEAHRSQRQNIACAPADFNSYFIGVESLHLTGVPTVTSSVGPSEWMQLSMLAH